MNDKIGALSYPPTRPGDFAAQRPYSEETAELVDTEVRALVQEAYDRTLQLLTEKRDLAKKLAELLLEKEVIQQEDVAAVLGPRPFKELRTYEELSGEAVETESPGGAGGGGAGPLHPNPAATATTIRDGDERHT